MYKILDFELTENLVTGVDKIDLQHKELLSRASLLANALGKEQDKAEIEKLMSYLEKYVHDHFVDEEELQVLSNYPAYEEHRLQHRHFTEDLLELRIKYLSQGMSSALETDLTRSVIEWVLAHIYDEDKRFATHYKNFMKSDK